MILADYFFKGYLEEDEKVIAVIHRHPFVLIRGLFPIVLIGFVFPAFLWYLFPDFILFFAIWFLVSLIRAFREFMIWYHDAFLVTSMSIIDVYWHGFFDRSSTRLEYPMMEGVTTEIRGFRRILFNYGTVSVQRGGGTNPLILEDAINPRKAERKIMDYQEEFMRSKSMRQSDALKELMTEMLHHHYTSKPQEQEAES